jgi:Cu(I)/Ag(I) efflux system periplasmic protein CusF
MYKKLIMLTGALGLAVVTSLPPAFAQEMVSGEVTKVDEGAGKLTIKHGPIKKFDMEGMTMVFRVGDPAMLKTVKPGDKVQFEPDKVNGQMTVVKLQKAK